MLTALADSPVGLATFMLEHHDAKGLALISRVFDLRPDEPPLVTITS